MSLILIVFCIFSVVYYHNLKQQQDHYTDRNSKFAELREQQSGLLDLSDFDQPYYETEQGWSCLRSPIAVKLEFILLPLEPSQQRMLATGALQGMNWPGNSEWGLLGPDKTTANILIESPIGKWLHAITFPAAKKKRGYLTKPTSVPYEVKAVRLRGGVLTVLFAQDYSWEELGKFSEYRQHLKTALLSFRHTSQTNLRNPLSQSLWIWYLALLGSLICWNYQISPVSQFWDFSIHWLWLLIPFVILWKCGEPVLEFFDRYQLSPKVSARGLFKVMAPWWLLWFWLVSNEFNVAFSQAGSISQQWYVLAARTEGIKGPWFAEILPKHGSGSMKLPINQALYKQLQGGESVEIQYLRGAFGKPWICRIDIEQSLYYQFPWKICSEALSSSISQLTHD